MSEEMLFKINPVQVTFSVKVDETRKIPIAYQEDLQEQILDELYDDAVDTNDSVAKEELEGFSIMEVDLDYEDVYYYTTISLGTDDNGCWYVSYINGYECRGAVDADVEIKSGNSGFARKKLAQETFFALISKQMPQKKSNWSVNIQNSNQLMWPKGIQMRVGAFSSSSQELH